jgi:hypothetical protein
LNIKKTKISILVGNIKVEFFFQRKRETKERLTKKATVKAKSLTVSIPTKTDFLTLKIQNNQVEIH